MSKKDKTISLKTDSGSFELDLKEATIGPGVIDIRTLYGQTGLFTFDPSYSATASCESYITYIDGTEGILEYRGYPIEQLAELSTYLEVAYLLFNGELPSENSLDDFRSNVKANMVMPEQTKKLFQGLDKDSHPMAMFNTAVLAMEKESVFRSYYDKGMNKNDFWKPTLEDGIRLIAKLPALGAGVYRIRFEKGNLINPDQSLDWGANYAHMLGLDNSDNNLKKLMRLYLMLHCDHEGGNASAFTSLTIGSTLSDLYYAVSGGLNALAGPLHGLANQECLKFVLDIRDEFGGAPSKKEIEAVSYTHLTLPTICSV